MDNDSKLAEKLNSILPYLNERQKRLLLAAEARSLGYGGVSRVSRLSRIILFRQIKKKIEQLVKIIS